MISRYLVITLALVAAGVRITQGAYVEATGLVALAGGLTALRFSARNPKLKRTAYLAFGVTVMSIVIVLIRQSR